jgi:hypothetical protein
VFDAPRIAIPTGTRRAPPRPFLPRPFLPRLSQSRRRLLGLFDRAPFATASLLALAVTTATLAGSHGRGAHVLTFTASTNLHNLLSRPVGVLFASAFWVSSAWMFVPIGAALVVVVGAAERRFGTVRTVLVFVVGHVGATLVTVAGIALGVAHGWLPASLTYAIDVGPSYGLAAVGAVLVARTANPRLRSTAAVLLVGTLVLVVVVDHTFTDVGHLAAVLMGFGVSRLGRHERGAQLVTPVGQGRLVVQAEAAALQRHRVEVSQVGDGLFPLRREGARRAGGDGDPRPLGEVLLPARAAVVGGSSVGQDCCHPGSAGVPRPGPARQRHSAPGPGHAVRAGREPGVHPVLLAGTLQRVAADPDLPPATRSLPDDGVLDGQERPPGKDRQRIRAP